MITEYFCPICKEVHVKGEVDRKGGTGTKFLKHLEIYKKFGGEK